MITFEPLLNKLNSGVLSEKKLLADKVLTERDFAIIKRDRGTTTNHLDYICTQLNLPIQQIIKWKP